MSMRVVLGLFFFIMVSLPINNFVFASNVKGKILNVFGEPVGNAKVIATCDTDIEEEQSKAKIQAVTNKQGEFILKNGLIGKTYDLKIIAHAQFPISNAESFRFSEKGTRLLKPITIADYPSINYGAYILEKSGAPRYLQKYYEYNRLSLQKSEIPIYNSNPTIVAVQSSVVGSGTGLYKLEVTQEDADSITLKCSCPSSAIDFNRIIKTRNKENNEIVVFTPALPITEYVEYYGVWSGYYRDIYIFGLQRQQMGDSSGDESSEIPEKDKAEIHFKQGVQASLKGDWRLSIREFEKSLVYNSSHAGTYNNLGFAYMNIGDNDKSIQYQQKALEYEPKMANAYYGLAMALEKKGDKKNALLNWKKFLTLSEQDGRWAKIANKHIQELEKLGIQ